MASNKNGFQVRAEYALAAAIIGMLRWLPMRAADAIANLILRLVDVAVPRMRRTADLNLQFAMPEIDAHKRKQIIRGVFGNVSRLLVAVAQFPNINGSNVSRWISYEGLENFQAAKEHGKGVLVATAHLGNWELSAFAHALMTEPMYIMVRPLDNPLIDRFIERRRTLSGNQLILKRDAARSVLRALRDNAAVGILIDQNTTPPEGVFVSFFGKQACAGSAFVKFAHHSGAAVVPGFALWDEPARRYVLRFYPEVEMTGDVQLDTQRIHSLFEQIIRQYPDQWMWIHRRWKTRPEGEAPLY